MPKKGELSKTARASLANREATIVLLDKTCRDCGERILSNELLNVKVLGPNGRFHMESYHKEHYKMQ